MNDAQRDWTTIAVVRWNMQKKESMRACSRMKSLNSVKIHLILRMPIPHLHCKGSNRHSLCSGVGRWELHLAQCKYNLCKYQSSNQSRVSWCPSSEKLTLNANRMTSEGKVARLAVDEDPHIHLRQRGTSLPQVEACRTSPREGLRAEFGHYLKANARLTFRTGSEAQTNGQLIFFDDNIF